MRMFQGRRRSNDRDHRHCLFDCYGAGIRNGSWGWDVESDRVSEVNPWYDSSFHAQNGLKSISKTPQKRQKYSFFPVSTFFPSLFRRALFPPRVFDHRPFSPPTRFPFVRRPLLVSCSPQLDTTKDGLEDSFDSATDPYLHRASQDITSLEECSAHRAAKRNRNSL